MSTDDENELYQAFLESGETRLIAPAENNVPSVEFRHGGGWRECRIWEGYLDASSFLLREVLREYPRANNLIFPAMFNLRHGIEVSLKWHIKYAGGVVPARAGHNLRVLLKTLQEAVNDEGGGDDEKGYLLFYFSKIVFELDPVDPRATAFRYSTELDGSPIEIEPSEWDLRHLYFVVSDLPVYLDNLSSMIDRNNTEEN
ncbi:hypothetical protein GB927_022660 [Shinella sp. CPCC 100929]|uniref:Uncharacterized protein n=1 Tax=Shinella lacus TaxID=2654216 RepID=A0ABT1RCX9_9HYPH|nr:hypothetical protein [Shinella lacus]MCQ4632861.1 hypothetical protein [Shinella lacus]